MIRTLLAAVVLLSLTGCWSITPPPKPLNPVTIYVTNYGFHTSLLLPVDDGKYIEYVFGDWRYAVENHDNLLEALRALLISDRSAFGRRFVRLDPTKTPMAPEVADATIKSVEVERAMLPAVLDQLDYRYRTSPSTQPTINPLNNQAYVRDSQHYWVGHSCNHLTAQLIREMGGKVDGFIMFSNWSLNAVPSTQSSERPTTSSARSATSIPAPSK